MAEVHQLPGSSAPVRIAAEPVPVQGWDCETSIAPGDCAVMVNPAAPNSALADWARAHVEQTCWILRAFNMAGPDESGEDHRALLGALQHFQQQASSVLRELSVRLQQIEVDAAAESEG